ncbi:hypothetical protein SAMN02746089_00115 [Caldanaerobius fijiensis DSM 17918]|uniref:Ribosomal processing cysteine protease Prp n=1 Tax=Caldanaerobius fijiensis DSM 17918 TaxID=1121256 RepID=A0A1M4SSC7_9THEO|nr:ribosomal-processing cysteine protease Prp [Caldanaerobius fijiensis]SHE35140.1 hypothetical protein SAMN02746089_00115 [Caldanaerobius fijiensis DSM 17918]
MIEVVINRNCDGKILDFKVTGHAGYGEYGKDIVCAAVSAVVQTALLGVKELTRAHVEKSVAEGKIVFKIIEVSFEDRVKMDSILETMVLGLKDIAEGYGKYLKVEDRRC